MNVVLAVRHEIRKLPEAQRVVAWLTLIEGRELSEVALILRSPYNTTKANLRFAVMKLRERV
jgi:DNA-directed RNA polymerase specialized sigma24 family protein